MNQAGLTLLLLRLLVIFANIQAFVPIDGTLGLQRRALTGKENSQSRCPSTSKSILFQQSYDAVLGEETFTELYSDHLPSWLLEKCKDCGWEYPTLIQQRALDTFFCIDADKDTPPPNSVVIQAQTGSGKTLTYLLPLLAQLEKRSAIQAMIVVPTRELGLQVATVAKRLAAPRKFLIMSLLQGSSLKRQRAWAWAEAPQVVIGTPSELLDMVQYGGLPRINSIQYVVVDEVDACLLHKSGVSMSTGGSGETKTLASSLHILLSKFLSPTYNVDQGNDDEDLLLPGENALVRPKRQFRHRQTVFASATIPQHRHFLKQCKANQWTLEEPIFVCTSPGEALPPTLQHAYMVCTSIDKKLSTLRRIVNKLHQSSSNKKILVFCDAFRTMESMALAVAKDVNGTFYQEGKTSLEVDSIVSVLRMEDSLSQRAGATQAFASAGSMRVMITTDLAARGLDIASISHVIHFDLPPDSDTYLHRSGRSGRFGQKGQVLSIITPEQEFVLQRLSNALQLKDLQCVGRQKVTKGKQRGAANE